MTATIPSKATKDLILEGKREHVIASDWSQAYMQARMIVWLAEHGKVGVGAVDVAVEELWMSRWQMHRVLLTVCL